MLQDADSGSVVLRAPHRADFQAVLAPTFRAVDIAIYCYDCEKALR
jgi:hypothetical protein